MLKTLRELRERVRYLIDRAFAREFAGQLLLFVSLVLFVTAIGTTAILFGLFGEENAGVDGIPREIDSGIFDAAWWSLSYVMRLPAFESMYGSTGIILVYSIAMSIMGLGVFGVLVSVINNAMRTRIERLRQGDTPVKERGHILILGWNNKIVAVLRQLATLKPGSRVVILAQLPIGEMAEELRVAGILSKRLTVVLRTGVPSNRDELNRVAVHRASGIIILSNPHDDSSAIKTLVLLSSRQTWPQNPPTLTAEIAQEQNYELAQIGARDRVQIVSSSRVTSKVIVQTIRNPGLARVYDELMAIEGNSIYVERTSAGTDRTLAEFAFGYSDAVPIGITWQASTGHKAALNPEPDYDLADEEGLVLIAPGKPARFTTPSLPYESSVFRSRSPATQVPRRILLVGWTDELHDILRELNAHATLGTEVTLLSGMSHEHSERVLPEEARTSLSKLTLDLRHAEATERQAYAGLDLGNYDSLVVLADENADDPDTRSLSIMLRISEVLGLLDQRPSVIVELMDGANRRLFDGLGVTDIVVTTDVLSAQLAQICRQPVLGSIYSELLSAGGVEITLRPASDYLVEGASFRFADLIHATQQKLEIALGLYRGSGEMLLNPSREQVWQLEPGDRLIVLAEQIYQ